MKKHIRAWMLGIVILFLNAQCNTIKKIENVFKSQTPYEKYVETLKSSGIDSSLLGRNWLYAGTKALSDSLLVNLPYFETGYFSAENSDARAFNFLASEGSILHVEMDFVGDSTTSVFLDLFRRQDDWQTDHVVSADLEVCNMKSKGPASIHYEFNQNCLQKDILI